MNLRYLRLFSSVNISCYSSKFEPILVTCHRNGEIKLLLFELSAPIQRLVKYFPSRQKGFCWVHSDVSCNNGWLKCITFTAIFEAQNLSHCTTYCTAQSCHIRPSYVKRLGYIYLYIYVTLFKIKYFQKSSFTCSFSSFRPWKDNLLR